VGEEPRGGRKIRITVTDTAGVTDSVEIRITREKLEAIFSAVEAHAITTDEALEELLVAS
jgi:hypothetical protein